MTNHRSESTDTTRGGAGPRRVAVMVPLAYRGGSLRAAKDLARMLQTGSRAAGADIEVVLACLSGFYDFDREFADVRDAGVAVRPLVWKEIDQEEAGRVSRLAGIEEPKHEMYSVPADGGNDFLDCDLWLLVSDRLEAPLLPLRPYGLMLFDYVQRYVPEVLDEHGWELMSRALVPLTRAARFVLVTTPAAAGDLNSYVGVSRSRIFQIPIFFDLPTDLPSERPLTDHYLVWVTNPTAHKNHERLMQGLLRYYGELQGTLKTLLIGTDTGLFRPDRNDPRLRKLPHVRAVREMLRGNALLRKNVVVAGELTDFGYAAALRHARFLLHGSLYDNGTFSVIDAAALGVPSLSARYPAMEYLNETCKLNLSFFDPYDVADVARALKGMEERGPAELPDRGFLAGFHWKNCAGVVWQVLSSQLPTRGANVYR